MAKHLFVERSRPPFDHAAFIDQAASEFGQTAAFRVNFAIDHFVHGNAEGFALLDQDLNVSGDARIDKLIANLADIWRKQIAMAREDPLVALVNDQMKVIDLDRVAIPVFPKQPNGFKRKLAGLEIAHK